MYSYYYIYYILYICIVIRSNKYTISVLSNNIFDLILSKYDLKYNNRRKEVNAESK